MKNHKAKPGIVRKLLRPFMAGLLALFPLVLTIVVIAWLGAMLHDYLGPESAMGGLLRRVGLHFATSDGASYLMGAVIVLAFIYVLGILIQVGLKRRWEALTDHALNHVPVVGKIYDASKKIAMMLEPRGEDELKSMTPVLCSFGGDSGTTIPAFMPSAEPLRIHGKDYRVVMIPTAPIPFGGAIMCVPAEWIQEMDCGIDGLFNIYVSMGVTMKDYLSGEGDTPVDTVAKPDPE